MPSTFHKFQIQFVFTLLFLSAVLPAFATDYSRDYGPHPGYVSSVLNEKNDEGVEIPFLEKPKINYVQIKERIFNSEISREFQNRYEEKFGRTEAERVYNSPNKDTYYDDLYTLNGTPQQVDDQKRAFGNYIIARLIEYHTDNYLKNDPSARPIYEAKERLSSLKVEVQDVKFDAKYELAGNTIDLRARAPWFDTKITFGSSQHLVSLTRAQTPSLGFEARYLIIDQKAAAIVSKRFSRTVSASFTASASTADSTVSQRETLYLAGLSLAF